MSTPATIRQLIVDSDDRITSRVEGGREALLQYFDAHAASGFAASAEVDRFLKDFKLGTVTADLTIDVAGAEGASKAYRLSKRGKEIAGALVGQQVYFLPSRAVLYPAAGTSPEQLANLQITVGADEAKVVLIVAKDHSRLIKIARFGPLTVIPRSPRAERGEASVEGAAPVNGEKKKRAKRTKRSRKARSASEGAAGEGAGAEGAAAAPRAPRNGRSKAVTVKLSVEGAQSLMSRGGKFFRALVETVGVTRCSLLVELDSASVRVSGTDEAIESVKAQVQRTEEVVARAAGRKVEAPAAAAGEAAAPAVEGEQKPRRNRNRRGARKGEEGAAAPAADAAAGEVSSRRRPE